MGLIPYCPLQQPLWTSVDDANVAHINPHLAGTQDAQDRTADELHLAPQAAASSALSRSTTAHSLTSLDQETVLDLLHLTALSRHRMISRTQDTC